MVQITSASRQANVVTVSTRAEHKFAARDAVWVWLKAFSGLGLSFRGMAPVASVPSSTNLTFKLPGRDVGSTAAFGWTALENTAIENNAKRLGDGSHRPR